MHRAAVAVRAALELPVELGHQLIWVSPFRQRVAVRAVGRGDHVAVAEGAADADCNCLLADRDMQEPGQIARAKTLLDLLLEPPNEKHLAEELAQRLLRDPAALLDFRHWRDSTLRAMTLVEQFRELESRLPEAWDTARLRLTVPDEADCERAAALLGPLNPGRRGEVIHIELARRAGFGADRVRALLRRVDSQGV